MGHYVHGATVVAPSGCNQTSVNEVVTLPVTSGIVSPIGAITSVCHRITGAAVAALPSTYALAENPSATGKVSDEHNGGDGTEPVRTPSTRPVWRTRHSVGSCV